MTVYLGEAPARCRCCSFEAKQFCSGTAAPQLTSSHFLSRARETFVKDGSLTGELLFGTESACALEEDIPVLRWNVDC